MLLEKLRERQTLSSKTILISSIFLLVFLIAGCSQSAVNCNEQPYTDLSEALTYAANDQLPFQYPLDELGIDAYPTPARFCRGSWEKEGEEEKRRFHAAEDYHLPAGSPVYAFADGEISFSGRMDGYGWLIIIDHPQANIYSLYGHLSPSRWYLESGTVVEKGDLIAYLGDSDENGGSAKNPLVTHLHFGIRAGQRTDYTGMGEWRWMAGWIKPCPSDLGWLQPSLIITSQEVPPGGFQAPKAGLVEGWGIELSFILIYFLGTLFASISSIKKKNLILPAVNGIVMILAGYYFSAKGTILSYPMYGMAAIAFGVLIYLYFTEKVGKENSKEFS